MRKIKKILSLVLTMLLLVGCSGGTTEDDDSQNYHTHVWSTPTYVWGADYLTCIAMRTCALDSTHTEIETASSICEITNPTCLESGTKLYTAIFNNPAFQKQTYIVSLPPTGHDYASPTYSWNDDNSKCTAKMVCKNDNSHVFFEVVDTSFTIITEETCTSSGLYRYFANFASEFFSAQTKDVVIQPHHFFGEPTYSWNADHSKCTAQRVCAKNSTHKETETVNSSYSVTLEPKCESEGIGEYTASFQNSAFSTQTYETSLDPIGHQFGEPTYQWGDDYTSCTALKRCINDSEHVVTETSTSIKETITKAYRRAEVEIRDGYEWYEHYLDVDYYDNYYVDFADETFEPQHEEIVYRQTYDSSHHSYATKGYFLNENLYIPNFMNDIENTTIDDRLFKDFSFKEVYLSNSITEIGIEAFCSCVYLEHIQLSNNLTSIGNNAFAVCSSLASITLPDSVQSIGSFCFANCSNLLEINYLGSISKWNSISKYGWAGASSIEVVHCSDGDVNL